MRFCSVFVALVVVFLTDQAHGKPQRQIAFGAAVGHGGILRMKNDKTALVRVSDRPANPSGRFLVLEYHKIEPKESRWGRTPTNFRKDLEALYEMGYRPITVSEYIENSFELPPGASPVMLTFDDASPGQFRILPDGSIDPNCAVGVWKQFADKHPDFPVKGTWYLLPTQQFGNRAQMRKKAAMLMEWGSELGIHTLTHRSLRKLPEATVKAEIAGAIEWVRSLGAEPKTMAYPYGEPPKNMQLVKGFRHKGKEFGLSGAVMVGAYPYYPPTSQKFNPFQIPRIQGMDKNLGITQWLKRIRKGEFPPYVAP